MTIYNITPDCTTSNSGAPIRIIPLATPVALAFSPDNTCFAVSSGNSVFLYSVAVITPTITATTTDCATGTVTISGSTSAHVIVNIFANGSLIASTTSDANGSFSITTGLLPTGTSTITAQAQNPVTLCISAFSNPITVFFNTAPVITQVVSTCLGIALSGTATPNSVVTVHANETPVATAVTNGVGRFIAPSIALTNDIYCFVVTDTNTGCMSVPVCATITVTSCVLSAPNLAFGSHCNV